MPLIAVTARICTLYGDFSGRSDSRFSVFRIASRFPREKRVLLSVQRLVATASGPAVVRLSVANRPFVELCVSENCETKLKPR